MLKKVFYWLFTVSRGYSAPMSILNWLVIFVYTVKTFQSPNVIYGIISLVGILFAHLGTNLFDDCIDYILKVPKQECKTEYLENGFTSIKWVFVVTAFYFCIALITGIFFFIKFGSPILYFCVPAFLLIILYPKLNNFSLGELAVGLCFGVLLFSGVHYVMTGNISQNAILISLPVSLLTVAVLVAHALMDFEFDKKSGKFTFCQLLKTKNNALLGLMGIYLAAFGGTLWLIFNHILPKISLVMIILIPFVIKLYTMLKKYNDNEKPSKTDFLVNFKLARNISVFYNLILVLIFLLKG